MFRRAEWVAGEGEYASLAWCRVLTVILFENKNDALMAKAGIDDIACGGRCYGHHEVIRLVNAQAEASLAGELPNHHNVILNRRPTRNNNKEES
jgi:hypothetical protein